ncbi:hypothetical protein R6Q59_006287 [Mikania micrantha]
MAMILGPNVDLDQESWPYAYQAGVKGVTSPCGVQGGGPAGHSTGMGQEATLVVGFGATSRNLNEICQVATVCHLLQGNPREVDAKDLRFNEDNGSLAILPLNQLIKSILGSWVYTMIDLQRKKVQ